jgi:chromosome segregation ATPase
MPRDAAERVMRSLGREFGDPGSEANPIPEEAYEAADMSAVGTDDPEPGEVAGGEPEARTAAQLTDTPDTMGDTNTDPETVEELRADLQQKEETVEELRDQVEQLEAERADVAEAYADALAAGDTVLEADDFSEKFTVAELRERYESAEDATLADAEPAIQSGGTDTETATLSDADQEEVAERREAIAALAGSTSDFAETQAEQHAERIAELTDEDVDAILADMD